jgi:hypothetical protein
MALLGSTTADGAGNWSIPDVAMAGGAQSVDMKVNGTVVVSGRSFTVEDTLPSMNAFNLYANDTAHLGARILINNLNATHAGGIAGYLITESATKPSPADPKWVATVPTSWIAEGRGSVTFYPWAKDAAGNISALFASPRTLTIQTTPSVVLYEDFASNTLGQFSIVAGAPTVSAGIVTMAGADVIKASITGMQDAPWYLEFRCAARTTNSINGSGLFSLLSGSTYTTAASLQTLLSNTNGFSAGYDSELGTWSGISVAGGLEQINLVPTPLVNKLYRIEFRLGTSATLSFIDGIQNVTLNTAGAWPTPASTFLYLFGSGLIYDIKLGGLSY